MKKNKLLTVFILVVLVSMIATTVFASSAYLVDSHGEFLDEIYAADQSANGNEHLCTSAATREEANKYPWCWWHDTSAQNALASHTADEFPEIEGEYGYAERIYTSSDLNVLVYHAERGPNVTAIVGSSEMLLVGSGGGQSEANYAKIAFQRAFSGFMGKHLKGIILLDATPEQSWGVSYWRNLFGSFPVIVNAAYESVRDKRNAVQATLLTRQSLAYADVYPDCTDPNNPSTCAYHTLPWGVDGFLGEGSMKRYDPRYSAIAPITSNDIFVKSQAWGSVNLCEGDFYTCYLTGGLSTVKISVNGIPVIVAATSDQDAGLIVFIPTGGSYGTIIVVTRDGGEYLPDVASLTRPNLTVGEKIKELNWALYPGGMGFLSSDPGSWDDGVATSTEILISSYGMPIIGRENVSNAIIAQRDSLKWLHNETLKYIGYGFALDDIVINVYLPPNLSNSPYTQQFVGTKDSIVRNIYHEYLGWFEGDVNSFNTFSTVERAARTVNAMGGEKAMLKTAKDAITEHTLSGVKWALELVTILRQVYPSDEADDIYLQALKMLAGTTRNAPERNYYLSLISIAENPGGVGVDSLGMEPSEESIEP